jgi:hypothetical protein
MDGEARGRHDVILPGQLAALLVIAMLELVHLQLDQVGVAVE